MTRNDALQELRRKQHWIEDQAATGQLTDEQRSTLYSSAEHSYQLQLESVDTWTDALATIRSARR